MDLPPELLDDILIYLRHDTQSLRNCSLVAKTWTYSSQKLLYAHVSITPSTYRRWQEIASPTSAELLRHVHSLTCRLFDSLYDFRDDYLKSFHCLQELDMYQVHNIDSNTVNLFPAFRNTLSSLSLFHVSLTLDAFIKLLGYFSNLKKLHLYNPTFDTEHLTAPPPSSTSPSGTLSLYRLSPESMDIFLRGVCGLELEYDELVICGIDGSPSHFRSLISTCEKTLTHLKLGPGDVTSIRTLENLSELRELAFIASLLLPQEASLISTINPTNIRKIVFNLFCPRDLGDEVWSSLDTALKGLVDRLRASGYQHVLDLEFQRDLDFAEKVMGAGLDGFLPKFRKKGRVTISHSCGGRILYCSDGPIRSGLDSEDSKGPGTAQAVPTPVVRQGF